MLKASSPLDGFHIEIAGTSLSEITDLQITSAAARDVPQAWPEPGYSNDASGSRIIRLAIDQAFILGTFDPVFHGNAVTTDQSDSWAALRLRGPLARAALERICMIDLHPAAFGQDRVARTLMEHLNVIIICTNIDDYLLLSARSSAVSFLHAVETSLTNAG